MIICYAKWLTFLFTKNFYFPLISLQCEYTKLLLKGVNKTRQSYAVKDETQTTCCVAVGGGGSLPLRLTLPMSHGSKYHRRSNDAQIPLSSLHLFLNLCLNLIVYSTSPLGCLIKMSHLK